MPSMQKISPCLWFDSQAEEAAKHYINIFDGHIGRVARYGHVGQEIHKRPPDSVMTVEFEILNCSFTALNGGPVFKFNEAISLQIFCDNPRRNRSLLGQARRGRRSKAQECGWLKDKYGVSWQLVPPSSPPSSPIRIRKRPTAP
jgi:predicted 3-demethylubiquinone-9 3-methyltransferase (glyoxalase superfamily)